MIYNLTYIYKFHKSEEEFQFQVKFQVCFIYIAHLKTASMADQSAEQTKT